MIYNTTQKTNNWVEIMEQDLYKQQHYLCSQREIKYKTKGDNSC
jgi:hypothetical protein